MAKHLAQCISKFSSHEVINVKGLLYLMSQKSLLKGGNGAYVASSNFIAKDQRLMHFLSLVL